MVRFSERANSIRPTGVRRMFDMAGDDAVQFGLGEPDFQPPDLAIDAFEKAMRDGRNKYATTAGLPELRQKIAETWHYCPLLPPHVVICGGQPTLYPCRFENGFVPKIEDL